VLLISIVVGSLHITMVHLKKIVTSKKINSIVYHIKLILGEKAQPESHIRHTSLHGALSTFEKIKGF